MQCTLNFQFVIIELIGSSSLLARMKENGWTIRSTEWQIKVYSQSEDQNVVRETIVGQ